MSNWYKKAQQSIILWYGAIPIFADIIENQGVIKPDLTTEKENKQLQTGIYLLRQKSSAIYYTSLELEKKWQELRKYI